jgi:hypothetical protein
MHLQGLLVDVVQCCGNVCFRQQELDALRLEFASQSRAFANWIEDAEDFLSEPVKVTTLEAVQELQNAFDSWTSGEYSKAESQYNELVQLSNKMQNEVRELVILYNYVLMLISIGNN